MWAFGRYRIKTQKNSNIITEIKGDFVIRTKVSREFKSVYVSSAIMLHKDNSCRVYFRCAPFFAQKGFDVHVNYSL